MTITPHGLPASADAEPSAWDLQWAAVPSEWRTTTYPIGRPPYDHVFVEQSRPGANALDCGTPALPRIDNEIACIRHLFYVVDRRAYALLPVMRFFLFAFAAVGVLEPCARLAAMWYIEQQWL